MKSIFQRGRGKTYSLLILLVVLAMLLQACAGAATSPTPTTEQLPHKRTGYQPPKGRANRSDGLREVIHV